MLTKKKDGLVKINIIGVGTIGEATGVAFHAMGHNVVGYDIKNKETFIGKTKHIDNLSLQGTDITMICVPTPTINGKISLDNLLDATKCIGYSLKEIDKYHLVVVRSTVLPYTTEKKIIPILEKCSGKKAGKEFGICMHPEFLRQRKSFADTLNPWIIVIGSYDKKSHDVLYNPLSGFSCPIVSTDLKTAEMIKYAHNLFNSTKISFFNEVYMICEDLKIESEIVSKVVAKSAEGSWNTKYGIQGGSPYEGSCLPKDMEAFISYCHEKGLDPVLLKAVKDINEKIKGFRSRTSEKTNLD